MQFLYSKNNGKGGGVKVNKPDLQVKYETLERISKQVEDKGLGHALEKTQIYEGIQSSGVKDGTKEGLLKEAGFTPSEVQALRDKQVTKETPSVEKKALERMNSAVEKISKEFDRIIILYLDLNSGKIDNRQYVLILDKEFGISNLKSLEKLEDLLDK